MFDIEERHLRIIRSVLSGYDCAFFLFGSRAAGNAKPFSDADILFFEDLPDLAADRIAEAFEESDLPYKVDLVDYRRIDADFRRLIAGTYVCLQTSSLLSAVESAYLRCLAADCVRQGLREEAEVISGIRIWLPQEGHAARKGTHGIVYGRPECGSGGYGAYVSHLFRMFGDDPFEWQAPLSAADPQFRAALAMQGLSVRRVLHILRAPKIAASIDAQVTYTGSWDRLEEYLRRGYRKVSEVCVFAREGR